MTHRREHLAVPPASVIRALPAIGKLMITAKRAGATHERIGSIEAVTIEDGWLVCSGAEHDSRIDASHIATVIVDRTSIMGDQAYPRIDFIDGAGEALFSVVGFGGLAPFDAGLVEFGAGEPLPEKPSEPRGERPEVDPADPGARPFNLAKDTSAAVSISFSRKGFWQNWTGQVEKVNPAMGFINVMRPDFHLHLRANTVADWRRTTTAGGVTIDEALDGAGEPTGLVVRGLETAAVPAE
ncbi:MAG: Hemin transport protein HmuS [Devosia sp.]|nr:Hemin transport protein HmuS [Devosia sp.]